MSGKLIVLEGLDGSGKATQAALLDEALRRQGVPVQQGLLPRLCQRFLRPWCRCTWRAEFGSHPDDVNAYAASCFYAVDRYASYKTVWGEFYRRGGTVLADRYTTSNAVHQCAKLPREQWDEYLDWLFDFEYHKMGIPAPDAVIYLRGGPGPQPAADERPLRGG